MSYEDQDVKEQLSQLADALIEQVGLQIELFKAELARDASELVREIGPLALATGLLTIGYLFACVAAAFAIAYWLGPGAGAGIIGAANLLAGGLAVRTGLSRRKARRTEVIDVP